MRVLLVSQEMPPETGWGGIGTYVDVLSEALAARGAEVHVLSAVDGQPASDRNRGGVNVHRRPVPAVRHRPLRRVCGWAPEAWRRFWLSLNVARLAHSLGFVPDVIECPEWMAEGFVLGLRASAPLVVRLHSTARQLFPYTRQGRELRGLDGRLSAWLEECSARRAHVVISTRSNLEEVSGWMRLDDRALHPIAYPVRLPDAAPMPDPASPRVTFVGRLEPRKAPEVLLRAAPLVLEQVPDARFVFVGRDAIAPGTMPSREWMVAEAHRLGVLHAVEFTGQLDGAGVAAELRRATVCAFPSRWESFGNVVAEASATGRPVVASDIPPFRELVADGLTGSIAASDLPEAWASPIIELLSHPARAGELGLAGARRIAGISAPGVVAEQTLSAYEDAVRRHRGGRRAAAAAWPVRMARSTRVTG